MKKIDLTIPLSPRSHLNSVNKEVNKIGNNFSKLLKQETDVLPSNKNLYCDEYNKSYEDLNKYFNTLNNEDNLICRFSKESEESCIPIIEETESEKDILQKEVILNIDNLIANSRQSLYLAKQQYDKEKAKPGYVGLEPHQKQGIENDYNGKVEFYQNRYIDAYQQLKQQGRKYLNHPLEVHFEYGFGKPASYRPWLQDPTWYFGKK